MALVQGQYSILLAPGLKKVFIKAYGEMASDATGIGVITLGQSAPVCELHVVDIGDGMLVPTELLRDLFGR